MYTLSNMKRLDASNEKKKPLGNAPILAEIKLTSLKPAPKPTNPLSNANFEDTVELVGFDLDQSKVHSGDDLQLTLYWRARQNITEDYTVFAQLLSSGDIIYGQKDGQPAGGEYPTRLWDEGEIVADRRVIRVQSDAPVGKYRLIAGMYLPATNRRLTIVGSQNQDFLTISEITVSSGNVHD